MLLVVDRTDDLRDRETPSKVCSHEGRSEPTERREPEPDDVVRWLWCLSMMEALFTCLLRARIRSGDGGPSTAGSKRSAAIASPVE
jgi:hypothetical protein